MFDIKRKEMEWGGKKLSLETGKIGRQASSVIVRYENTVVMCNVTIAKKETTGIDFVPLTVSYIEKFYSAGKIPGGFVKRETKPSDNETLIARTIDRPVRPLFPSNYRYETNVFCTLIAYDETCPVDIIAMIGASAALGISPAPFEDIIAGARVSYKNGEYLLNKKRPFEEEGKLDLTVAGTKDSILMVESEAKELTEDEMLKALAFGHEELGKVVDFIKSFISECRVEKLKIEAQDFSQLEKDIKDFATSDIKEAYKITTKQERVSKIEEITEKIREKFVGESEDEVLSNKVDEIQKEIEKDVVRKMVLNEGKRIDGRKVNEVRPIKAEIDILPIVHGSALFTRGETQALVITTLGSEQDAQMLDSVSEAEDSEAFLLHYNFPPYAVGEVGALRAPGRREIGHGKLAWKAIHGIVNKKDFPYTIRVVSEVTESNGSSSMATVCGTSLSLMASGVPMKAPVSGIAMGLIKEENDFTVLSDIMGDEDHLGDMDFKVAGTKDGITALQMDIKCKGVNEKIMTVALNQAKEGRFHILEKMAEAISESRPDISETAPRPLTMKIKTEKIKEVIGPKGKNIKEIIEKTGTSIDISDDGTVVIMSNKPEANEMAKKLIEDIVGGGKSELEMGKIYEGKVVKLVEFGAFVDLPGKVDGFVHISQLANYRVEFVEDIIHEGDVVKVKLIGFDKHNKPKLSYKAVDQKTGEDLEK
ncbi:MAG TPA: polyribonucleotide nucleotidyltransferase [Rickettsiales bacterium]|nr:polyribonucleotide nucleotidyltransferase [Rickettsiales bacterium]